MYQYRKKLPGKKGLPKPRSFKARSLRHSIYENVTEEFNKSSTPILKQVQLPDKRNMDDWLNVHVRLFYVDVYKFYEKVQGECRDKETCKIMLIEKLNDPIIWIDYYDSKIIKKLSAYDYVNEVFTLAQCTTSDQQVFSENKDTDISSEELLRISKRLCTEFFLVLGHIYRHHNLDNESKRDFQKRYERIFAFVKKHKLVGDREFDRMKNITDEVVTTIELKQL